MWKLHFMGTQLSRVFGIFRAYLLSKYLCESPRNFRQWNTRVFPICAQELQGTIKHKCTCPSIRRCKCLGLVTRQCQVFKSRICPIFIGQVASPVASPGRAKGCKFCYKPLKGWRVWSIVLNRGPGSALRPGLSPCHLHLHKAPVREGHDGTGDRVDVRPKRVAPFVQLQLAKLRIPPRLYSYVVWPDKRKGNFQPSFPISTLLATNEPEYEQNCVCMWNSGRPKYSQRENPAQGTLNKQHRKPSTRNKLPHTKRYKFKQLRACLGKKFITAA